MSLQDQRPLLRVAGLVGREVALFSHPLQHIVAPHQRGFRVDERAQPTRRLDDGGDHGRLFQRELLRWLVEVQM